MNWLYYLLEANLYLGVFYLCYCLFLHKETYYVINRAYLLFTCTVSFIIPLIQVGILKPALPQVEDVVSIAALNVNQNNVPVQITPAETHFNFQDGVLYLYLLGVIVSALLLAFKLYQVFKLTKAASLVIKNGYKLVHINNANTAFSFFNYLFISKGAANQQLVISHELIHIRQKHSFDIMLLEIFKAVNWFNPVVYLLQNSLKNIHEYIADEKTAKLETDAFAYADFLVNNAYGIGGPAIAHSFFNYNLLKKRIIMLHQKRSGSLARLKYLFMLPLCAVLLCTSTLGFSKNYGWFDIAPGNSNKTKTLPAAKNDTAANATDEFKTTKKGYKYKEDGYLIKNKTTDFRVIIIEDGAEQEYFRNAATAAQIKLLKEKYGYTFPTMKIYPMLPPPPPAPPMAAPVKAGKINPPPPPMPPAVKHAENTENESGNLKSGTIGYVIDPSAYTGARLFKIGNKLYKQGFQMNFDESNDINNGGALLKISIKPLPGTGWDLTAGASGTFRMEELKKSGYVIFVGADVNKKKLYVHSDSKKLVMQEKLDLQVYKTAAIDSNPKKTY